MKIAIIGAGFTGLSAAYQLSKKGYDVTVYEKDPQPGGLAIGYQEKNWDWTLEKHYHHWFTNDDSVLNLAKELSYEVLIKRPHTNWFINGKIYEFDSIPAALRFSALPFVSRIRNLATLGFLRFDPFWKPLEKMNAHTFLPKLMGSKAYKTLWEPLFINKFGTYAKDVSLAWFWARIKKRTQSLAYPKGGFLAFANHLVSMIEKQKGNVFFNTELITISETANSVTLTIKNDNNKTTTESFDKVIVTLPSFLFVKATPSLPESYKKTLSPLKSIGATNLVLRLKEPFFPDSTYWLSVADTTSPIMAIVEHTNFMDKKHYNNEHLLYLGNYLSMGHPNYSKTKDELLKLYDPYLKKINADYKSSLIGYELFKAPFAQPIIPTNYSKMIPPFETPFKNVYLANIQQVYPWDRGTNYAVELGEKVAKIIAQD